MREYDYDVVVAGGGLAGTFAACAAAREGKKVLLAEKSGCLGGAASAMLVAPFMPFRERGSGNLASGGLFRAMLESIYEEGGSGKPLSPEFNDEILKVVLDRTAEKYGVNVLFHATLAGTEVRRTKEGLRVTGAELATVAGKRMCRARVFVDATGDADLCAFAGFAFERGREEDGMCQPLTTCFRVCNADWSRVDARAATRAFRALQAEGKMRNPRENILIFPYADDLSNGIVHVNSTRVLSSDPTDPEELSRCEAEGREQALELFRFLREHAAGFERAFLVKMGEVGVRESRRVAARYRMEREDVLSAAKFEDGIARGTYCIDIHNPVGSGTVVAEIPESDYYNVPYRSLVPRNSANVLVCGRPVGCSHEAHSAIRVMPITACTGEAAGLAAALAADGVAVGQVDVGILRRKLTEYGALV